MVGVPHSKGCISCRARRKGCDAKRPSCGQCLRRGVECPGYAKDLKMVYVDPGKQNVSRKSGSSLSSAIVPYHNRPPDPGLQELQLSLASTAFRSQTYARFVTDYAPHLSHIWPRLPTNVAILPSTSWIQAAVAVAPADDVLNHAITALALAQVGRTTKQAHLLHSSRRVYFDAVASLNRRLADENGSLADETLAAASALSIYEMQEGSRERRSERWASHIRGASALIQLRGRLNFATPLANRVFLGVQISEFIAAVGRRKRAVNASLWSQVYQDTVPESNFTSPMQLFEILHTLPQLMKEAETIGEDTRVADQGTETTKALLAAFINRCQYFEIRLVAWYDELEAKYKGSYRPSRPPPGTVLKDDNTDEGPFASTSLYWFEPSSLYAQLPPDSPHRIFPFFVCFIDPDIGYQTLLHWTALLLMYSSLLALQGRLRKNGVHLIAGLLADVASPADGRSLALLVAQSLEYFVHPDMGFMGTNLIGFPLSVSQRFLQHTGGKEILWYDVIFSRLRSMKSGLSGFLDDMAKGDTVKLASPWHHDDQNGTQTV